MRQLRRNLFLTLIPFLLPISAQAEQYYFGIMAGSTTYEEPGFEFKVPILTGKLGYRINDMLSAEVHAGVAGSDDVGGVSMDLTYLASGFVRGDWSPVDDGRISLYGLIGFSAADMEFKTATTTASSTESGVSYAVGVDLYADRNHGVFIQWGRYLDDTLRGADYTLDNLSAGYIRNF